MKSETTRMAEFQEHDWDAFAGAENFSDGSRPQIGSNDQILIVASGTGSGDPEAFVTVFNSEGEEVETVEFVNKAAAIAWAEIALQ